MDNLRDPQDVKEVTKSRHLFMEERVAILERKVEQLELLVRILSEGMI